jgi:hypothetical protein
MSKPNASLAVMATLVLCCLPMAAATTSNGIELSLGGSAQEMGRNLYEVPADSVATIKMQSGAGDLVWLFAVAEDAWGEPNYSNILTLVLDAPKDGAVKADFLVPAELGGMIFHLQAIAQDAKGDFYSSDEIIVVVPDTQVLAAPTRERGARQER